MKTRIDQTNVLLDSRRTERNIAEVSASEDGGVSRVVDEEEFALVRDLKALRKEYGDRVNVGS